MFTGQRNFFNVCPICPVCLLLVVDSSLSRFLRELMSILK